MPWHPGAEGPAKLPLPPSRLPSPPRWRFPPFLKGLKIPPSLARLPLPKRDSSGLGASLIPLARRFQLGSLPPGGLARLPSVPLPRTLATVALLVLVPSLFLLRWSRPRAAGLEQLMASASLVQSFPATPERPVPALWIQRLGPAQARLLWQRQRRVWWQVWANQAEAAPFLVLEADRTAPAAQPLPPLALRVGDLLVLAEDPIARKQLAESLRPLQRRSQASLAQRCLQRLQGGQAVYWNAGALGEIVGPVAPLFERFQVGCLSLALETNALRWQGEAAAVDGRLTPVPSSARLSSSATSTAPAAQPVVAALAAQPPLPADLLVELEGSSLDQLLQGLLARQMIRDPLASSYGLDGARLAQARQTPFRLRLRPQGTGPFQASLELQLAVGGAHGTWKGLLDRIRTNLLAQGFKASDVPLPGPLATPVAPTPSSGSAPQTQAQTQNQKPTQSLSQTEPQPQAKLQQARSAVTPTVWTRPDGTPVGGWTWIPGGDGQNQLLLFLGPNPPSPRPFSPQGSASKAPTGQLHLRLRPEALEALGLLPEAMPPLLRRASQLWLDAEDGSPVAPANPISRLRGRLQVPR